MRLSTRVAIRKRKANNHTVDGQNPPYVVKIFEMYANGTKARHIAANTKAIGALLDTLSPGRSQNLILDKIYKPNESRTTKTTDLIMPQQKSPRRRSICRRKILPLS
jgi:hypothetical protein